MHTVDTPPAPIRDRDTGCVLFASCLRCPLPGGCVVEYGVTDDEALALAQRLYARWLADQGTPVPLIARALGIPRRTAYRWVEGRAA